MSGLYCSLKNLQKNAKKVLLEPKKGFIFAPAKRKRV